MSKWCKEFDQELNIFLFISAFNSEGAEVEFVKFGVKQKKKRNTKQVHMTRMQSCKKETEKCSLMSTLYMLKRKYEEFSIYHFNIAKKEMVSSQKER